jgi:hypothetical protein
MGPIDVRDLFVAATSDEQLGVSSVDIDAVIRGERRAAARRRTVMGVCAAALTVTAVVVAPSALGSPSSPGGPGPAPAIAPTTPAAPQVTFPDGPAVTPSPSRGNQPPTTPDHEGPAATYPGGPNATPSRPGDPAVTPTRPGGPAVTASRPAGPAVTPPATGRK